MVELPDQQYGLVVGDVVGRGLTAATVMGQLRSAARALLLENNGPAHVLSALDHFSTLIPAALCTTVFCAILDPHRRTVRYSSAGHLPALLAGPDGHVKRLDQALAAPLALRPAAARPEAEAPLPENSTLLLYTDGLVERRGEGLDVGIQRGSDALALARHLDPREAADHLAHSLLDGTHSDDAAFLLFSNHRPAH